MTRSISLLRFLSDTGTAAPVLGALDVDAAVFSGVRLRAPDDYVVRELRASRMRTTAGVFDEFAAAFQFPYYFGHNRDAFDECLRDLDDFVGAAAGYVVVIRDAERLLADRRSDLDWFTEAVQDAAEYWAARDVVFRVVLQHPARELLQGAAHGAAVVPLTMPEPEAGGSA